jgi:hypothetical protein
MEYPNRNIEYIMQKEADKATRDYAMFGDALNLGQPDKRFASRFAFKDYAAQLSTAFGRRK